MRANTKLLIILCMVCSIDTLRAQTTVEVSEPVLSLKNDIVLIDFNLLNSSESDRFTIRIEVSSQNGKEIKPQSLSGDVGAHIDGGNNKRIAWDIGADSVFLNEEIYVQIYALPESMPEVVVPTVVEDMVQEAEQLTRPENKQFNRTAIILQSLAFPGLGLSRLNPGKPHWIRGISAYGCLAASVIYNQQAYNSYHSYLEPESPQQAEKMFNKASSQKKTSEILAYTAIGIWVADLVWTIAGTSDLKNQHAGDREGISIGTTMEPLSNVPLLAFRYRF